MKTRIYYIVITILLLTSTLTPGFGFGQEQVVVDEMIRVAIAKNAATVVVDGEGVTVADWNGNPLPLDLPVTIKRSRNALIINGVSYRRLTFSSTRAVYVNGKPYRGNAEISSSEKGLLVVNELPLEQYLVGLINCEISSAWPIEAVKAQAVIARTYALQRKETRKKALYHLESTVIDQVYEGCLIEDSRAARAVHETAGEVLVYEGKIIQAFYHSNCGGRTEASENVWGAPLPYLKGVSCEYCLANPSTSWEQKLSLKQIEERLRAAGHKVGTLYELRPGPFNNRGRLKYISAVSSRGTVNLTGDQFRKALGYGVIKSTNFKLKTSNGDIHFFGLGNGHGVGLCQWGAKQRALEGFSYAEILSYYYPGTELRKPQFNN